MPPITTPKPVVVVRPLALDPDLVVIPQAMERRNGPG